MRVDRFDFHLPPELIAERPLEQRERARLLYVRPSEAVADRTVADLPDLLCPGDLMVFNDTRVIPARLYGRRGAVPIEVLLHRPQTPDTWSGLSRPAKRLRVGQTIDFEGGLAAEVLAKDGGWVTLRFNRAGALLLEAVKAIGHVPLPPYIRRADDARDRADYQTIFAARDGAVAAPTAGLHFTPSLTAALEAAGIGRIMVTLHVGAGTFLPVSVEDTDQHVMHAEWGEITDEAAAAVRSAQSAGKRIVAVGTTALRVLETAAASGRVEPFCGDTALFIRPGYRFRAVDVLFTNFHLPRSTLYMLVSAFAGTEVMRAAYAHAIARGYRFFSYGDACLLERAAS